MKKNGGNVVSTVRALVEPVAERLGYSLWDVEYVKEGADMFLRITIDSPAGITIDDCEAMHRAVDPLLDEADPIEESYHLEVSSPGLERELRTDEHLRACEGWDVEARLYAPVCGAKTVTGKLLPVGEDGTVRILCDGDGKTVALPRASIASLRVRFDFDGTEA